MIDLRKKELPDTIMVDGSFFKIKTDFRYWIEFSERIKDGTATVIDLSFVLEDIPALTLLLNQDEFLKALYSFYNNPNATPNNTSADKEQVVDYVLDGEYIVGSFYNAYHIDLTSVSMHWHLFKALFVSLPDDCMIKKIMSYRAYKKTDEKYETQLQKLKNIWKLPINDEINEEDKKEIMDEINNEFYNA